MTGMIEGFFVGFEIFQVRDFFGKENLASIFWGWLDLSSDFLGLQNKLDIRGSACVSWLRSSVNKVQPNLFCGCFNIQCITLHLFHKTG